MTYKLSVWSFNRILSFVLLGSTSFIGLIIILSYLTSYFNVREDIAMIIYVVVIFMILICLRASISNEIIIITKEKIVSEKNGELFFSDIKKYEIGEFYDKYLIIDSMKMGKMYIESCGVISIK